MLTGRFIWAFSPEILLEYEEFVAREMGAAAVPRMFRFIEVAGRTRGVILRVSPSFRFRLIAADPDDDKFADCAIAAGADYLITSDHHFDVLIGSGYRPRPITPEDFIRRHLAST